MAAPTTTVVTGKAFIDLARKHIGESYLLGVQVAKNNPNWHGPWDCAEFASWVVFQVTGKLYGCDRDNGNPATADAFTGFWDRDARNLGEIISIADAARTPGAALLRVPQPGAIGHVVFSVGNGRTIEAHSHADGVIEGAIANRRWDMGILVPGVVYNQEPEVEVKPPDTPIFRLTTPLMHGPEINAIQRAVRDKGFDPGDIDGQFGPHTQAAIVAFQIQNGLIADGEVGPVTMRALGL
jgi:catechol 2,3-dioxygenase-like lactoylglutathione lyase family enzyme